MINLSESRERNAARKGFIHFPSTMSHLRDHNGFRPGELHLLIGIKGGGKSSLFRSWICECLHNEKRVFVRLSEEKSQDYMDEIVENLGRVMEVDGIDSLKVDSELELKHDQHGSQYFDDLTLELRSFKADILFFDNITTSELSDSSVQVQGMNAKKLRALAMKLKIPVVVAIHTIKGFKDALATGDDVRGNMTIANTAAYIYTINVFYSLAEKPAVLFVDKARHHSDSNKALYELSFAPKVGLYVNDSRIYKTRLVEIVKQLKAMS